MILLADREGPDQTAHQRSLIWAFDLRICQKTHFHMARPICEMQAQVHERMYIYEVMSASLIASPVGVNRKLAIERKKKSLSVRGICNSFNHVLGGTRKVHRLISLGLRSEHMA